MGVCKRAEKYARNLLKVINEVEKAELSAESVDISGLLDAARRYAEDTFYFIDKGDCQTALVSASYAEGLLDALKYLGFIELEWPSPREELERKVFVGGTFDILHPGHIDLLEFASHYGKLYVVVARDSNVLKNKGKKPILNEASRLRVVSSIRYVYEARLGDEKDIFKPVREISPDVIVLGPDQPFNPEKLRSLLKDMLGKDVKVIRYSEKREFEKGMRGSRDIIRTICCRSYCHYISCEEEESEG